MPSAQKQSSKTSHKGNSKSVFDAFQPDTLMNHAQQVLSSAVNVLEEEIAAGILAAKELENKVIDVEQIREDPRDLMNRIRRDIHEAVDLLMDSVTSLTRHFGSLTETVTGNAAAGSAKTQASPPGLPVLRPLDPVKPGDTVELEMSLDNHQSDQTVRVAFQKTDLTGPDGAKISSRQIKFQPASLELQPGKEQSLALQVKVPKTTPAGLYTGLFTDQFDAANRVIVELEIV